MVISEERKFMVPWCVDHMLPTISSLFKFLILCSSLLYICSSASDSIMFNNSISDERGETLVSANGTFELGFFTPNESSRRYVGIWYYNFTQQTVVWVANRDSPLSDRSGSFGVTEDGNLKVLDGKGNAIWYTKLKSNTSSNTTAKLLDSGNLVLSNETSAAAAEIVWESFRNPTDTFLPGMIMDASLNLISWKTSDNPAQGSFIFKKDQDTEDQFKVWKDTMIQYWTSETDPMPPPLVSMLSNNTMASCGRIARGSPYTPCHPPTNSKSPYASRNNPYYDYSNKRVVMSSTGEIRYLSWDANKIWSLIWRAPKDQCGALDFCGKFGSCNINNPVLCKCLPGFHPSSPDYWESGKFSGGCFRKSQICSKKDENETFLSLKMMKVRDANTQIGAGNETECRNKCLDNCNCQAYSYDNSSTVVPAVCLIWTEDLTDLQEEYGYSGSRSVSVRVYPSDIASINRSCMTCGTNIIPYPLSTGPTCGDPLYSYFLCDNSTGQLSFVAPGGGTYKVTGINPNTQIFVIQTPNNIEDYCDAKSPRGQFLQLDKTLSFYVNSSCTVRSDKKKSKGRDELEISWYPPSLPPTCNSSIDCGPHSTCKEKGGGIKRCLCNDNFQWNNSSMNCTQLVSEGSTEPPVKPLEQPSSYKFSRSLIIGIAISSVVVVIALSCAIVYISYLWKRRLAQRQENMDSIQRNQALYGSERHVRNLIDSGDFREEDKKGIDVPFFDLESILAATDNFSDANKLGQGGFGSVYKGTLPGGREIAVKRLSSVSLQGLGEFKNEVVLIAKLQHRNLVRLLGYCIKGEEKILLYEYMPNKSLDSFIFDRTLSTVLNWELRFNIILGIARGLLYLHQDSRLRIIHRDLKTSNILLDEEMNPKISDFGLARIFEGKQIEGTTNRVVGTYGYMSPEYALDGLFSIKSDVFSFGVVVLEIISGRRNTGFYQSKITLSLLGYAWKLWNEDQALDLMHETLREACNTNEFLRCLNVGLLCVQEDVSDRPTMSNVVFMLGSETTTLPTPKQPAFTVRRDPSTTASSSTIPETSSNSAIVEGR